MRSPTSPAMQSVYVLGPLHLGLRAPPKTRVYSNSRAFLVSSADPAAALSIDWLLSYKRPAPDVAFDPQGRLAAGKHRQVFIEAIGKKRSRFTSIAALRSAPRRTDQLWCLHSALNDACQLKSLNTIGGSGHAGYRLRKAGDAPTPSVDLHSIRRLCNYVSR
jgi:hypothetical protein